MNPQFLPDPFGSVPKEVVLQHPPLKLALAQISFPDNLSVGVPNSPQLASFQKLVQDEYPIYEEKNDSSAPLPCAFKSEDGGWEVLLNRNILILSTTQYRTRDEFSNQFCKVVAAAKKCFNLSRSSGLGVRFVDRVEDKSVLNDMEKYVNPAFLISAPFRDMAWGSDMQLYLTPSDGEYLNLRWGLVPPNRNMSNVDLLVCPSVSWVLCSDMYAKNFTSFDLDQIADTVNNFSGRIYTMFRHVFNDDFIHLCGGKI